VKHELNTWSIQFTGSFAGIGECAVKSVEHKPWSI